MRHQCRILGGARRSGRRTFIAWPTGQLVDTSLFEAGIQQTYWQSAIFFATGEAPGPGGSAHHLRRPTGVPGADGWLTIGGANQANWERLVRVLGAPEWLADALPHQFGPDEQPSGALAEPANAPQARSVREWTAASEAEGVPCGPINSIAEMASDPQSARAMVVELDHPRAGATRALGLWIKLSATPGVARRRSSVSTRARYWGIRLFLPRDRGAGSLGAAVAA